MPAIPNNIRVDKEILIDLTLNKLNYEGFNAQINNRFNFEFSKAAFFVSKNVIIGLSSIIFCTNYITDCRVKHGNDIYSTKLDIRPNI